MGYAIRLMAIGWLGIAVDQADPAQAEAVLRPGQEFRECPDVLPGDGGTTVRRAHNGSPPGEAGRVGPKPKARSEKLLSPVRLP